MKIVSAFSLLTLLLLGFLFKMWFMTLVPQPMIFDQEEYRFYAYDILDKFLAGRTGRTYAYPLFLASLFSLFGRENFQAVFVIQAILDIFSGLFLYFMAKKLFSFPKTAFLVLVIQLFNPFTTAYVGVLLTEIVSAFLIVLSAFLFLLIIGIPAKSRRANFFLFLEGVTLGLLTQTRPAFLYFNIFMIVIIPFLLTIDKKSLKHYFVNFKFSLFKFSLLILSGTLLASSYQIVSNLKFYQEFSLTSVDSYLGRELYDGALLKVAPLFPNKSESYPIEMRIMYAEYSTLPRNAYERKQMSQKYLSKAVEIIKRDPLDYLSTRIKKMWSMWQKPNIFFYFEPNFDKHWVYTYLVNLMILLTSILGLILSLLSKNIKLRQISLFTLLLLTYMTFTLSLTHAEHRLTIPSYPILFLFSAIGLTKIFSLYKS